MASLFLPQQLPPCHLQHPWPQAAPGGGCSQPTPVEMALFVPHGWAMPGRRSLAQCPQHCGLTVKVAAPQSCGSQKPRNSATVLATWEGRGLRDGFWGRTSPQLFLQKQLYSTKLKCSPSHPAAARVPGGMACPRPLAASHAPGILPRGSHLKTEKITILESLLNATATQTQKARITYREEHCAFLGMLSWDHKRLVKSGAREHDKWHPNGEPCSACSVPRESYLTSSQETEHQKGCKRCPQRTAEALGVGQRTALWYVFEKHASVQSDTSAEQNIWKLIKWRALCNAKHLNDVCTHKDLFSSAHIQPSWTVGFDLPFSCQNIVAIPQHLAFLQRKCIWLSCPHINQSRIWVQGRLKDLP